MVSSMNRLSLLTCLSLVGMGLSLQAQNASTITISTVPSGAKFVVDGQLYTGPVTLVWPTGSKHLLQFVTDPPQPGQTAASVQTASDGSAIYIFSGWVDNSGLIQPQSDPIQTITANPAVTSLTANLSVSYRLTVNYFNSSGTNAPPSCGAPGAIPPGQFSPGVIFINGACFWSSVTTYIQAGSAVSLNAFPYPGYVFTGWATISGQINPYLTTITMNSPQSLSPEFTPGKRVHFLTSPLGLNVLVDHTTVPTRTVVGDLSGPCPFNESQPVNQAIGFPALCLGDFDFAPGSTHVISGVSPQMDQNGAWWVFTNWSNGLGANGIYTTDNNPAIPDAVTANFVQGANVSFITNPAGLQLNIDGRQNWPSFNFIWGLGSKHTISASATETNSQGRQYTFQGWSNGGAASQTLTIDQTAVTSGLRLTANFSVLSRVVVQSSPTGQTVQIDGSSCQTPCTIDRPSGTQVHLTAPSQIPMGAGARLDFSSWSDGGASDHMMTVNQDYTTLTVSYTTSYQLSATSTPANGVSFQFAPASSDMFYAQNTQVTITATPNPGYTFLRWNGALSGGYPVGAVTMGGPVTVIAQTNSVPYIAPAGVTNAVGSTPSASVAAGSIISIFGQGLAPGVQVGPVNPLMQSLGGVSVTVNDSILPLLFVSQQQINAQVPLELPDGNYTLVVHNVGQPDVSAPFTVARNAPGVFAQAVNSQQYAVALHADGTAVTTNSPAVAGETISILGTGFGPYNGTVSDGFFPPTPSPALADTVVLTVGGQNPTPSWSGAAAGYTGMVSTTFTVPDALSGAGPVPLTVTVNGVDSNTVILPVQ